MPLHRIEVSGADRKTARLIRRCARAALRQQGIPFRALINVTVTDDEGIRELNRAHRNIDAPTDVLSFPLGEKGQYDTNPETGAKMLGDIVICMDRVYSQAEEYGHSVKREFAFLIAHSMLHLQGFDHMEPHESVIMEKAQEDILDRLDIRR